MGKNKKGGGAKDAKSGSGKSSKGKGGKGGKGGQQGGKDGGGSSKNKTCNFVKARHILCEKQGKISEAYRELCEGWLDNGDKIPPGKFGEVAKRFSECSSGKDGGNLG